MKKFEYLSIHLNGYPFDEVLNVYGQDGWELFQVECEQIPLNRKFCRFRREIPQSVTKIEDFNVTIPSLDGESIAKIVTIKILCEWDDSIKEWLVSQRSCEEIDNIKRLEMEKIGHTNIKHKFT